MMPKGYWRTDFTPENWKPAEYGNSFELPASFAGRVIHEWPGELPSPILTVKQVHLIWLNYAHYFYTGTRFDLDDIIRACLSQTSENPSPEPGDSFDDDSSPTFATAN